MYMHVWTKHAHMYSTATLLVLFHVINKTNLNPLKWHWISGLDMKQVHAQCMHSYYHCTHDNENIWQSVYN